MESEISHGAKGSTWKNHKYLYKVGNRYYYKEDTFDALNKKKKDGYTRYKGLTNKHDALKVKETYGKEAFGRRHYFNSISLTRPISSSMTLDVEYGTINEKIDKAISRGRSYVKKKSKILKTKLKSLRKK